MRRIYNTNPLLCCTGNVYFASHTKHNLTYNMAASTWWPLIESLVTSLYFISKECISHLSHGIALSRLTKISTDAAKYHQTVVRFQSHGVKTLCSAWEHRNVFNSGKTTHYSALFVTRVKTPSCVSLMVWTLFQPKTCEQSYRQEMATRVGVRNRTALRSSRRS